MSMFGRFDLTKGKRSLRAQVVQTIVQSGPFTYDKFLVRSLSPIV